MAREHIRLVHYFVGKFHNLPYSYEEKLSAAMLGCVQALNSFDVSQGIKFSTFLETAIKFNILKIQRTENKHLGNISVETTMYEDGDNKKITLLDTIPTPNSEWDWEGINEAVECVCRSVDKDKQFMLRSYLDGKTQTEIAKAIGCHQVSVGRYINKMFKEIKDLYWQMEAGV
ncbi:MAG: sigma-70 family RNA polymerase sigma factor [Bacillus sp. (in: firmicutes)]